MQRLLNVGLRLGTAGVRFLLIFLLARFLTPATLGLYGLFTVGVGYALYLVGLDFYTYVTRELLKGEPDARGAMLKAQMGLSVCLYLVFGPLLLLGLHRMGWSWDLLLWFMPLLVLEHFNQEVNRILTALSRQVAASVLLAMRQASWVLVLAILMWLEPQTRTLPWVLGCWAGAGVITAVGGFWCLHREDLGGWSRPVDWVWVRKGLGISAAFLLATLAVRGVNSFDRYALEALAGLEVVGAYTVFVGMAGAALVFLDAAIFAFAYPELIRQHQAGAQASMRARVRKMLWQTSVALLLFGLSSWAALPLVLQWIGQSLYSDLTGLYPWALLGSGFYGLGLIPHYALYAQGLDRVIIHSHCASLPVFALATWAVAQVSALYAVPVGVAIAFAVVCLWKGWACWRSPLYQASSGRGV